MAYGKGMALLSPCSPEDTASLLERHISSPRAIMDIGCGRGETLALLSKRFPDAALFGLEPDKENAASALKACPRAEITLCSVEEYAGGSCFDVLLAECVFSLMENPEKGASALNAMLSPDGVLLLSDLFIPDEAGFGERLRDGGAVKSIYSKSVLEAFFAETGLEKIEFHDRKSDMLALAGQMIMDGVFCDCIDASAFARLRALRAGYGVWIFGRRKP